MKWLFDTNVVSESGRLLPDAKVTAWTVQQVRRDVAISAVTWAELRDGIQTAPERKRRQLAEWFEDAVVPAFANSVLPLTDDILLDWIALSRILSAKRATWRAADLLIAATARVHGLIIATRNLRDFAGTGVTVYNPWTDTTSQMESV